MHPASHLLLTAAQATNHQKLFSRCAGLSTSQRLRLCGSLRHCLDARCRHAARALPTGQTGEPMLCAAIRRQATSSTLDTLQPTSCSPWVAPRPRRPRRHQHRLPLRRARRQQRSRGARSQKTTTLGEFGHGDGVSLAVARAGGSVSAPKQAGKHDCSLWRHFAAAACHTNHPCLFVNTRLPALPKTTPAGRPPPHRAAWHHHHAQPICA